MTTIAPPYNSLAVARLLLERAKHHGISLNATQTQKLLYILYGYLLSKKDTIVTDEEPQMWPYGPLFPNVQKHYTQLAAGALAEVPDWDVVKSDRNLQTVVDTVLATWGGYSAKQLTEWSHKPGTPWEKAYSSYPGRWGTPLSLVNIYTYFSTHRVL